MVRNKFPRKYIIIIIFKTYKTTKKKNVKIVDQKKILGTIVNNKLGLNWAKLGSN